MNDFLHFRPSAGGNASGFSPVAASGSAKAQLRHLAQTAQSAIEAMAAGTSAAAVLSKLGALPEEQRATVLRGIARAPGLSELPADVRAAFTPAPAPVE